MEAVKQASRLFSTGKDACVTILDLNKKVQGAKGNEKERIQKQIDKTDREIDEIVYKLYCITDEERKIIEGEKT